MKLSRFNAIFNGLNGTAKKVYEAVPKTTHWSQFKIMNELQRLGKQLPPETVKGCLGYMLSVGIVEEDAEKCFKRTVLKMSRELEEPIQLIAPTQEQVTMATAPTNDKPTEVNAFDILAALGKRAQSIVDQVEDLKDDIEKAALQVQAEYDNNAKEMADLRQLKELLGRFK